MPVITKAYIAARKQILILDGAMGSMIQAQKLSEADFRGERFKNHPQPLLGCNDLLCLTKPEIISAIHESYLEAGADIIETCSFNSTAVSLADYGIGDLAYEISAAAATIARNAADKYSSPDKPRFVAGSIGPTAKSASLSPDMSSPAKRSIYWDELEAAYYDNARGLIDGGADLLIIETIFDTLNAKAALFAISRLLDERRKDIPVIISATVSDKAGRLLSGQGLAAFSASVMHAKPWALGLNCSFGAEALFPHLQLLAENAPCLVSVYPNAGLPDELGFYNETPEKMAASAEKFMQAGLVNIIGGCCGTRPEHIAAIAEKAAKYAPRPLPENAKRNFVLCGTELLKSNLQSGDSRQTELILAGERCNVSGSRVFLNLIREKNYQKALALARDMIANGAAIINLGMDDALLDAEKEIREFLLTALTDPVIAAASFMIDSSRWNVIETGLKCIQGRSLVNSISLKDGEDEFLRRFEIIRRLGAAAIVMFIDEKGQALSFERKTEIAGRVYNLLKIKTVSFNPSDIVFDPNVLTIATGIPEHDAYAIDFIRTCAWIKSNCPGVKTIGGISNLSFSFRGNNIVREAMHSVFLKHAAAAGLDIAIVNPAALRLYDLIEPELRTAAEDLILNKDPDAAGRLLKIAKEVFSGMESGAAAKEKSTDTDIKNWRKAHASERIKQAVINGIDDYIDADIAMLLEKENKTDPLALIEGPLLDGITEVGKLFSEARMYLPQVLRSAMVMKKAVVALKPFVNAGQEKDISGNSKKIVLATVKGDVHDIGKNIVSVVLGCNGYEIIDLGVMIPAEQIIETALRENAAAIGLSALISPSLDEMIAVARKMEKSGLKIPLLIGGAAASETHTALRIAPEYSGPVIYVPDAAKAVIVVRSLFSDIERPGFLESTEKKYLELTKKYNAGKHEIISLEKARENRIPLPPVEIPDPPFTGIREFNNYPLEEIIPYINWSSFLNTWELTARNASVKSAAENLIKDAQQMFEKIKKEKLLELRGVIGFFPAASSGEDLIVYDNSAAKELTRFSFPRNLEKKQAGAYNPCLADFFQPANNAGLWGSQSGKVKCGAEYLGLFALSAGFGVQAAMEAFNLQNDEYSAILLASLANTLAEAFADERHSKLRPAAFQGIRPAFGYPICPNHQDKRIAFKLLQAEERCGLALTETAMIVPAASVCGMYIFHPEAFFR